MSFQIYYNERKEDYKGKMMDINDLSNISKETEEISGFTNYNQSNFNQSNQRNSNQSNQSNYNQNNFNQSYQRNSKQSNYNQINFNQSNQRNSKQSNQSNYNQSNFNQSNQRNSKQSNQSNYNQSNFNQSNQRNSNQSNICNYNQSNFNQSNQSNSNQSNICNYNQSNFNQSNESNSNQSNESNYNQSNFNQRNQRNSNQSNESNYNQSNESNSNQSNESNSNQSNESDYNQKDYVQKVYAVNHSINDEIGAKYCHSVSDINFSINQNFQRNGDINALSYFNFNQVQYCPNHSEDELTVSEKYCLFCNQNYCDDCIKNCIKKDHIIYDFNFINENNLSNQINILSKFKRFDIILNDYLNHCDSNIEKIKKIKNIKINEIIEYQNFIIEQTKNITEQIYQIKNEVNDFKKYYQRKTEKIIQLIEEMKYKKNKYQDILILNEKIEKYDNKFNKDNIELERKSEYSSLNRDNFDFTYETIPIKRQNLKLNKTDQILYNSEYFKCFGDTLSFKLLSQGNNQFSLKLEFSNLNKRDCHMYYSNIIFGNKKKNKFIQRSLNKEYINNRKNIFSTVITKEELCSLINSNKIDIELFITKFKLI